MTNPPLQYRSTDFDQCCKGPMDNSATKTSEADGDASGKGSEVVVKRKRHHPQQVYSPARE